jgi:hypothetical protein
MIRLGTLAGYAFEGPRVLGGWTPPPRPAVYAILYKPDPDVHAKSEQYAVIFVGHSDDLSQEGFPFKHPRAGCWIQRAGSKWKIHIATLELQGGYRPHREQIVSELSALYDPHCNDEKFDRVVRREWIQDYETPNTTGPLTTPRDHV